MHPGAARLAAILFRDAFDPDGNSSTADREGMLCVRRAKITRIEARTRAGEQGVGYRLVHKGVTVEVVTNALFLPGGLTEAEAKPHMNYTWGIPKR